MAILKLRVDYIDKSDKTRPGRPTAYTVEGFECASMAIVSTQPGNPDRWVVHLAPPGARLKCLPTSFTDPEAALGFLQQWADEQAVLARERAKAS